MKKQIDEYEYIIELLCQHKLNPSCKTKLAHILIKEVQKWKKAKKMKSKRSSKS